MKEEITLKFLEEIKDFVDSGADLFEVFLRAGYGASAGKLRYEFSKAQKERRQRQELAQYRKRYARFLYRLRQDGLIKGKEQKSGKLVTLTPKGRKKLMALKERYAGRLPEVSAYDKNESDKFIIVVFDIPERERKKRDWLRSALKNIGLKLVQKSVWMGKVKVSKDFIDDLSELKLIDYVEIFEISKTGSLRHVI